MAFASGKKAFGSIPSDMEGGKLAASVFFFDLGIQLMAFYGYENKLISFFKNK